MGTYRAATPSPALVWRRRLESASLVCGSTLLACYGLRQNSGTWPNDVGRLAVPLAVAFAYGWWRVEWVRRHRDRIVVDVTPDAVRTTNARGVTKTLARSEMTQLVDRGNGFVIRASDPRRALAVPANLDHAAECRDELRALGLPAGAPRPRQAWQRRALAALVWSVVGLFAVRSYPGQLIVSAAMLASLVVAELAGGARRTVSREPAHPPIDDQPSPRLLHHLRRSGVALMVLGVAAMFAGRWWTHGAGGLVTGVVLTAAGVFALGGGIFMGTVGRSALAYIAVAGGGAAIGALLEWLTPEWHVGIAAGLTISVLSTLVFLIVMFDRWKTMRSAMEWSFGPFIIAGALLLGWRGPGARELLVAAGVIVTAMRVAGEWPQTHALLDRARPVLTIVGVAIVLFAWLQNRADLALAGAVLMSAGPLRSSRDLASTT